MTCVHDFCVDLARGGYSFKEINEAVERSFGVKAISRSAIYKILAMTKAGEDASDKRATIHATLHNDLGVSLRLARWVPRQLTEEHTKERICCCRLIVKAKFYHGNR